MRTALTTDMLTKISGGDHKKAGHKYQQQQYKNLGEGDGMITGGHSVLRQRVVNFSVTGNAL